MSDRTSDYHYAEYECSHIGCPNGCTTQTGLCVPCVKAAIASAVERDRACQTQSAIDAAVSREEKDKIFASLQIATERIAAMEVERETFADKTWALAREWQQVTVDRLTHENERLQADLATAKREIDLSLELKRVEVAAAKRTRIDPQAYRDLEIRINELEFENEKLKGRVVEEREAEREAIAQWASALGGSWQPIEMTAWQLADLIRARKEQDSSE